MAPLDQHTTLDNLKVETSNGFVRDGHRGHFEEALGLVAPYMDQPIFTAGTLKTTQPPVPPTPAQDVPLEDARLAVDTTRKLVRQKGYGGLHVLADVGKPSCACVDQLVDTVSRYVKEKEAAVRKTEVKNGKKALGGGNRSRDPPDHENIRLCRKMLSPAKQNINRVQERRNDRRGRCGNAIETKSGPTGVLQGRSENPFCTFYLAVLAKSHSSRFGPGARKDKAPLHAYCRQP